MKEISKQLFTTIQTVKTATPHILAVKTRTMRGRVIKEGISISLWWSRMGILSLYGKTRLFCIVMYLTLIGGLLLDHQKSET